MQTSKVYGYLYVSSVRGSQKKKTSYFTILKKNHIAIVCQIFETNVTLEAGKVVYVGT